MQAKEAHGGWILLALIYDFKKIRQFHEFLSIQDLFNVLKMSTVVEVKEDIVEWEDEQEVTLYIRKKPKKMKGQFVNFFGYDIETIKMLSKAHFEIVLKHKKAFEEQILKSKPIIVTTVGKGCTKSFRVRNFKRVIMDESTMVRENEAFLTTISAEQIVLVGDQKQLGPTYGFKVEGPTSLFTRLIEAGHPYDFLDIQYRMHASLMAVPNTLFYSNMIKCGYQMNLHK